MFYLLETLWMGVITLWTNKQNFPSQGDEQRILMRGRPSENIADYGGFYIILSGFIEVYQDLCGW